MEVSYIRNRRNGESYGDNQRSSRIVDLISKETNEMANREEDKEYQRSSYIVTVGSISIFVEKLKRQENISVLAFTIKICLIREGMWKTVEPQGIPVNQDILECAMVTIGLSPAINYSLIKEEEHAIEVWRNFKKAFKNDKIELLWKVANVCHGQCKSVEEN